MPVHPLDLYPLGATARLICSGETGTIIGRAEHLVPTHPAPLITLNLRYRAADGRAVEAWWNADAVEVAA